MTIINSKRAMLLAASFAGITAVQNVMALAAQGTNLDGSYHFTNRWPYGCVPYQITSTAQTKYGPYIAAAITEWDSKLENVDFYPVGNADMPARCTGVTKVLKFSDVALNVCNTASSDAHGAPLDGTTREIQLGDGTGGCMSDSNINRRYRNVAHEMGHALGFVHEHQRFDAGLYIEVVDENVVTLPGTTTKATQELKAEPENTRILSDIYDYKSIMHYHPTTNGILDENGDPKITLKFINTENPQPADINDYLANERGISETDRIFADQFYAPGIADVGTVIVRAKGCSQSYYDKGKCKDGMLPHQSQLEFQVINHGPYDSGTVTFSWPITGDMTGFELLDDPTGTCQKSASDNRYHCSVANIKPVTRLTVKALVTMVDDELHSFQSSVDSVAANDDFATNDHFDRQFDTKTAGGMGFVSLLGMLAVLAGRRRRR